MKRKLNVLDFIIIVGVIVALIGVGYKYKKTGVSDKFSGKDKIAISFYAPEKLEFLGNAVKVGSRATDSVLGSYFGEVSDVKLEDAIANGSNKDGEFVASKKEGYKSVLITVEGEGVLSENGATYDNITYFIGKTVDLRTGNVRNQLRVYDIKKIEE